MSDIRRPRRLIVCAALVVAGGLSLGIALLADRIGIGGQLGFGLKQYVLGAGGVAALLIAAAVFADDRIAASGAGRRDAQHSAGTDAESAGPPPAPSADHDPAGTRFRPDLEGLRALAVILVLLYHARVPGFAGGFVGVDVFFVLSGFLITGLLLRELGATGTIDLAAFYARRLRRILPAAAVVLGVTVVASAWILPPLRVHDVAADGVAAALYLSNVRFAFQATDYLQSTVDPSPLLHFWSLSVEEQFYLFWPALLLIVASRHRRFLRRGAILTIGIGIASFAWSMYLTRTDAPWAFFGLPTRVWELGIGALLAVGSSRMTRLPAVGATTAGWIGMGMLVLSGSLIDGSTTFPGVAALLPTVGCALVIAAGMREPFVAPVRILGHRVLRFLGRISYSLYLWHWPILVLPVVALERDLSLPGRVLLAVATIPVAAVSQRWVEEPIRRGRFVGSDPRRGLVYAGILTSFLALFSFGLGQLPKVSAELRDLPRIFADGCMCSATSALRVGHARMAS